MTRERWRGGGVLEIACDESGSDGENLTGGNTEVFAHASVDLSPKDAAACVRETRDRIRSPAQEYKANHLLREKHRAVLEWLLSPAGPVHGHAHVHVVDKAFFVVDRTVDLLLGERSGAVALFRDGPRVFGAERWRGFLTAANGLLRVRGNGVPTDAGDMFFRTVEGLRRAHPGTEPDGADGAAVAVLERLAGARERADAWRARTLAAPVPIPVLNPLLPAIVATAAHWSEGGRPVSLVHDRQNLLTPDRIAYLVSVQDKLLDQAAALVGPGGVLLYATCSILPAENQDRVAAFLARQPGFAPVNLAENWTGAMPPGLAADFRASPLSTGTDGFFCAGLRRA